MTATGTTTDVSIKRNDTPMTNEMLADRIGLLPIHITEPLKWKEDEYIFALKVAGNKDHTTYVTSSDFKIKHAIMSTDEEDVKESAEPTDKFFPPSPLTGDTCLIATLQPGSNDNQQMIEIVAKATKGMGREHARFSPVSQCSYEYTPDTDERRIEEMFVNWLTVSKKIGNIDRTSNRFQELQREFNTMQVKRCFKINEKGEPFSFDFVIETVGVLSVEYIVQRACEVGENMCNRYANLYNGDLPSEITITSSDSRIIGYDFLVRGHDHTLGNLLQTWLVENHIEGTAEPRVTYAGYSIPHPLRDEMVLRIGVEDGEETTARRAFAEAAKGCAKMFSGMLGAWKTALGAEQPVKVSSKLIRQVKPSQKKQ
jgi:DNA-directed RNA polymerase subunit L